MNELLEIKDAFVDFELYLDTILKDVEDDEEDNEDQEEEETFTRCDWAREYGVPAFGPYF